MSADAAPDLVLKNARLAGGAGPVDITLRDGRIASIEPTAAATVRRELDLAGALVVPGFVDAHIHLDKAYALDSGLVPGRSLGSAIAGFGRWRASATPELIYRNARRAAEQAVTHGTIALRAPTTVDSISGIEWLRVLVRLREEMAPALLIQVAAFAQADEILSGSAGELLKKAKALGVDLIGSAPAMCSRPEAVVDALLDLAGEQNCDLDLHVDETDDPASNVLGYLAERVAALGFTGHVTAGHCCSLAAMDEAKAGRIVDLVAKTGIHVVTLPMCNLYLMGRGDRGLVRRGLTRVRELMAAGVNVAFASDNIRDAFNPFGRADMLQNALVAALALQMGTPDEMNTILAMATTHSARILGLRNYGLEPGCIASLVVLDDNDWGSAVARGAACRYVFSQGQLVDRD